MEHKPQSDPDVQPKKRADLIMGDVLALDSSFGQAEICECQLRLLLQPRPWRPTRSQRESKAVLAKPLRSIAEGIAQFVNPWSHPAADGLSFQIRLQMLDTKCV